MKSEAPATVASAMLQLLPANQAVVQTHKIPLAAKVAGTAFLAVLVPVYLHTYGPTNFLWFCDAALILTVAGMWLESSLLISMCAVGILLPQCLWLADFGSNLLGFHFLNLTGYMFDAICRFSPAGFRFFMAGCPCCSSGSWFAWATINELCLPGPSWPQGWCSSATFLLRPPAPIWPTPTSPSTSIMFTVSTTSSRKTGSTKTFMSSLWLGVLWLVAFLPTHLALRKIFAAPPPAAGLKFPIRFL